MKKIILFTLLMVGFLLLLPGGSEASSWADPTCAPPNCNRPQPITVEGGTIQSGSLNLSSGVPLQAGDISVDDTGILVGAKLVPNGTFSSGQDKYLVCSWSAADSEVVCVTQSLGHTINTNISNLLVASNDILLLNGGMVSMTGGNNRIYISDAGSGSGGYGLYSQAHSVSDPVDIVMGYNSAIQGVSSITDSNTAYSYGVVGQASDGPRSFGVYATAPINGYAVYGYNTGGASADGYAGFFFGNFSNLLNRYDNGDGWSGNSFVVGSYWKRTGAKGEYEAEADVIRVNYSDADGVDNVLFDGDVYVGGDTRGTHQLCLNDSGNGQNCVSSWDEVSGQGTGNAVFKTIDVPTGTDPVADSAADTLTVSGDANILVYGNASIDSIGISLNDTLSNISLINGAAADYLYLDGDNDYGVKIYDELLVDGDIMISSGKDRKLCIESTCITESQLQDLLKLIN